MKLRFNPRTQELLQGAIDIHIHSAPDLMPRIQNDYELAEQARETGMRAILIKSHFSETAGRAALVRQLTGFDVFGGIPLNLSVGGLNPHAAAAALKLGAKTVWLPTLHARRFLSDKDHVKSLADHVPPGTTGIRCLNDDGSVKDELYQIFDLIIEHDSSLATGHVSVEEAKAVVKAAAERGVKKIVVTHPQASFVGYTVQDMKEILDLGATWLEQVINDTTRVVSHPITRQALMEGIKAVGPQHCIMSTDSGQWVNPVPAQQMGIYITDMLGFGFSPAEIKTMVQDNPAAMLGL